MTEIEIYLNPIVSSYGLPEAFYANIMTSVYVSRNLTWGWHVFLQTSPQITVSCLRRKLLQTRAAAVSSYRLPWSAFVLWPSVRWRVHGNTWWWLVSALSGRLSCRNTLKCAFWRVKSSWGAAWMLFNNCKVNLREKCAKMPQKE